MKFPVIGWLRNFWPFPEARQRVLADYRVIGLQHQHALADIALRGGLFGSLPRTPGDVFGDGINEGRRLLAIEIFELCNIDHAQLWSLIEKKPKEARYVPTGDDE